MENLGENINSLHSPTPKQVLVLPLYENGSVKQLLANQIRIVKKLREMSEEVEDVQKRKQIENMKSIIMSPTTKFSKTFFSSVTVSKSKDEEEEKEEGAFVSTKLCGDMELGEIKNQSRRLSDQPPMRKNPSNKSMSEKLSRNLLKEKKRSSSDIMDRVKKVRSTSSDQPSQFSSLVSQTTSTLLHVTLPRFLGGT